MSGLEASIAGTDTHMLGELSYALPASAQYMKKREEIYWTSGANVYAPNGIRTLRINVSGQGFLDCSSLVLEAEVHNLEVLGGLVMKPLVGGMEAYFQSCRVIISGTTVEELGDPSCSYGRVYQMLSRGLPKEKVAMDAALGFELGATGVPETIPVASYKKILHKPLAGICHQKVFLPLQFISTSGQGLTFEIQIVANGGDAVDSTGSTNWQLSNVRMYGDVLHVDESLSNTYAKHLLDGKNLQIPMRSYTSLSFQNPSGADATLMIPRTLSRVNAVFLVGWKEQAAPDVHTQKQLNKFCFPTGNAAAQITNERNIQAWLQVGSSRFPSAGQYEGITMFYYRWLKSLGVINSGHHTTQTTMADFKSRSFIICWDLETISSTSFSGSSLAGGSVSINLKNFGLTQADAPSRWDVILWHDVLASIGDGFCEVSI
jgi:hypothetical protein